METNYAPIVVFTYVRLDHTKKMMESLLANKEAPKSELYVFSDGEKKAENKCDVENVRKYLHSISGFKKITIIERKNNWGLANNLIDGITTVIRKHKRIIVVEDDLVLSPFFLKFMNETLNIYENEKNVSAISGFVNPVYKPLSETFFLSYFACWGWATWERSWNIFNQDSKQLMRELEKYGNLREFNIDHSVSFYRMLEYQVKGNINSWAIRFYVSSFVNSKLILFPCQSLTKHNGIDGSGPHSGVTNNYEVELASTPIKTDKIDIKVNREAYYAYRDFYLRIGGWKSHVKRLLRIMGLLK